MADPIESAKHFNDAVAATAVVGTLIEKADVIDKRTARMEIKLDKVVASIDRWGGVVVVVSALLSVITAAVAIVVGAAIKTALGF